MGGKASPVLKVAARIALTHHERWDGSGYPLGLVGEDIPIDGRITAVADVFDALTSRRVYKPAFSMEDTLKVIQDGVGKHFDPKIAKAFFKVLPRISEVMEKYADKPEEIVTHELPKDSRTHELKPAPTSSV